MVFALVCLSCSYVVATDVQDDETIFDYHDSNLCPQCLDEDSVVIDSNE